MSLTRSDLEAQRIQQMVRQANLGLKVLTDEELQASIASVLSQHPNQTEIWIFAYGSLIWNPIIQHSDRRIGTIYGWHRRYCLRTPGGRGTPEHPGLTLALDRGGSCQGVIYQLDAPDQLAELLLLWRREMVVGSYIPRWVKVFSGTSLATEERFAIAFTINPQHPLYVPKLSLTETAETIATAAGALGSCKDYLLQTIAGLAECGIRDRGLLKLRDAVLKVSEKD
ncbi:gamma-glutamylcyclotransferase [Microcoleus sp. FACHB-1515]|uniref:gamma-glutamylcyclotransferase n=1 Tax=Cyanophyceae TaxID=3028117 RepID=UPI0016883B42|nr:gamma-glutamylcyclotransferase [Microcoleus sp. FACHB-1515]MBD2092684.1 gamma-glutamylcyclotransferase [Microcoleus sp. FACHB-1515]